MRDFETEISNMIYKTPLREQSETLRIFDNNMKARKLSGWRRMSCARILGDLAIHKKKPFQDIDKNDLVDFFANMNKAETTSQLYRGVIKKFYKWLLGNDETTPNNVKWLKTGSYKRRLPIDNETKVNSEIVMRLIEAASHPRDKALIITLYESACRPHEILNLKIGNATTDRYGSIIIVNGKTGMRRLRLIQASPYLVAWINVHPQKDNLQAPLWLSYRKTGLQIQRLESLISTLAHNAGIKGKLTPYSFRHAKLTELSKFLTEAELKVWAGWTQNSKMASIYVHLSGRDIDSKILQLHGMKQVEMDIMPQDLTPRICPRCKTSNPIEAKFCYGCGSTLTLNTALEIDRLGQRLSELLSNPEVLNKLAEILKVDGEGTYAR